MQASGGNRTRNPSKRAATDSRLKPCGHWGRQGLHMPLKNQLQYKNWVKEINQLSVSNSKPVMTVLDKFVEVRRKGYLVLKGSRYWTELFKSYVQFWLKYEWPLYSRQNISKLCRWNVFIFTGHYKVTAYVGGD